MVSHFEFILLFLATFRLTHFIVFDQMLLPFRKLFHTITEEILEDGTIEVFYEVKGRGIKKWVGELISCYWCTGFWVACFFYGGLFIFPLFFLPLIILFSIAGCAAILETIIQRLNVGN